MKKSHLFWNLKRYQEIIFKILQLNKFRISNKSTSKGGVVMIFQSKQDPQKMKLDKNPSQTKRPLKVFPRIEILEFVTTGTC